MNEVVARPAEVTAAYHSIPSEAARIGSLLALLPAQSDAVLEIGARDGRITRLLCNRYASVVALDLSPVRVREPGCVFLVANLVRLPFEDDAFDAVLCSEVLEHLPPALLEQGCRELVRVTRGRLVVGVPFEQDLRIGRTTCASCGAHNPPWGHRTSFTRSLLARLLAPMECRAEDAVGRQRGASNPLSAWILDQLANPWGTYAQEEPCVACGAAVRAPALSSVRTVIGRSALALIRLQSAFVPAKPNWIHLAFEKPRGALSAAVSRGPALESAG